MSKHHDPLTAKPLPLFIRYALPSMLGLLAISSTSIIDGIFIGRWVGADALAALNIIMPLISIIYSVGLMICIGTSLSAGKLLGEKRCLAASQIFTQAFILLLLTSGLMVLFITLNLDNLLSLMEVPATLYPYIYNYIHILIPFTLVQTVGTFLYFFIKVDQQPTLATGALLIGSLSNILLDAVFVAGLGLGMQGAAWATGISMCIHLLCSLRYFFIPDRQLYFVAPTKKVHEVIRSCFNGFSEFINGIADSIMVILVNWMLIKQVGVIGVTAFAALNYVLMIAMMISFGLSDAMQVLITQNFGAKQIKRIYTLRRIGFIVSIGIGGVFMISVVLFPSTLVSLLIGEQNTQVVDLASKMSVYIWPLFLTSGINMLVIGYFTAIHKAKQSTMLAIIRTLILPNVLLILAYWIFKDLVALTALAIADGLAMLVSLSLMAKMPPEKVICHSSLPQQNEEEGIILLK